MANAAATLVLKVVTDAKDAAAGLDDTSKSVSKFSGGMKVAGAAAAVAGAAVVAFGVSAARAAAEDAQGQAVLANALENSTGARKSDIAAVEDWITKTSKATGVADDQMRPALATLARATGSVTESQKAMSSALDISAATGKDVGSVSDALAKAYAGNTASLGKLVPGIDKTVLASKDMNAIMAELARTTGGAAAASANTAAGKMERMQNAVAETKESIGAALLPAMSALASVMLTVSTFAQDNAQIFTVLLAVVGLLSAAVLAYSVYQKVAAVASVAWTAAQWLLNTAFLASPITWIVIGVVALIAAIVLIATKTTWFQTIWKVAWGAIQDAAAAVFDWVKSNWPLLLGILTGPVGLAVVLIIRYWDQITDGARAVWAFLSGAFSSVWSTVSSAAVSALNLILTPIHALESAFHAVIDTVDKLVSAISKVKIPSIGGALSSLNPFSATAGVASSAPPVSTSRAGGARPVASSSRGGVTINVNVPPTANPAETGRAVAEVLRSFFAAGGRLEVPA